MFQEIEASLIGIIGVIFLVPKWELVRFFTALIIYNHVVWILDYLEFNQPLKHTLPNFLEAENLNSVRIDKARLQLFSASSLNVDALALVHVLRALVCTLRQRPRNRGPDDWWDDDSSELSVSSDGAPVEDEGHAWLLKPACRKHARRCKARGGRRSNNKRRCGVS